MNSLPQVGQAVFVGDKAAYVVAVRFAGSGFVASALRVNLGIYAHDMSQVHKFAFKELAFTRFQF